MFLPALRRREGYQIGPKGAEQIIENFEDALVLPTQIDRPHWRRPNAKGNWGVVSGVGWTDVDLPPTEPES
jgi:hypothetical protein